VAPPDHRAPRTTGTQEPSTRPDPKVGFQPRASVQSYSSRAARLSSGPRFSSSSANSEASSHRRGVCLLAGEFGDNLLGVGARALALAREQFAKLLERPVDDTVGA
jgi:hypothetical protein